MPLILPNEHIIKTYQIVEENTSKDPKRIKSSNHETLYFKFSSAPIKEKKSQTCSKDTYITYASFKIVKTSYSKISSWAYLHKT